MNLNFSAIAKVTGILCIIIGIAMIPSLIVAVFCGEFQSFIAFAISIIIAILSGSILYFRTRRSIRGIRMRDGFLIVTLIWILAGILGALPFIISGGIPDFFDAFFESCSGFSTTGSTTLTDIERLPASVLFWRSFIHWLGGIGIVLVAIAILPGLGLNGQTIASAEIPGPMLEKVAAKMSDTARSVLIIYIALTVAEVLLLCFGGLSIFDAFVHTFGSVGTGGFSSYNASVAQFDSTYVNVVITIFMLLSGASFNMYSAVLKNGPKEFLRDTEFKAYIVIAFTASSLIALDLFTSNLYTGGSAIEQSAFQTVSILTTTGYSTADYTIWPAFSQMILFLLFFIGACSGSTGGGIKVIRLLVVLKYVRRGIHSRLHPKEISDVKINGRHLPSRTVSAIITHFFLFAAVLFVGTILLSFDCNDLITNISAVLSSIGNVGPGFGLAGPASTYSFYSGFSKIVLSIIMIAGRLELVTLFVVFTPSFWNKYK